jgi:hypothetical protein
MRHFAFGQVVTEVLKGCTKPFRLLQVKKSKGILLVLHYVEVEGTMILQNDGKYSHHTAASHAEKLVCSAGPFSEPQNFPSLI